MRRSGRRMLALVALALGSLTGCSVEGFCVDIPGVIVCNSPN